MTTRGLGAFSSAVAGSMTDVRKQHCQPRHYRPVETLRGSFRCTTERYCSQASTAPPDTGGSTAEMAEFNEARDEALQELEK